MTSDNHDGAKDAVPLTAEQTNAKLIELLTEQARSDRARAAQQDARMDKIIEGDRKRARSERWMARIRTGIVVLVVGLPAGIYAWGIRHYVADKTADHVGLVTLQGEISAGSEKQMIRMLKGMETCLAYVHCKGVIMSIDSPGGSVGIAERVRLRMQELRVKYKKPIVVFGGDYVASAAYLIASGADNITVLPSSLTGSIGVIYEGVGLVGLAEKLGIDLRVMTTGENKAAGNPLAPFTDAHRNAIRDQMDGLKAIFVDYVRKGRGDRLHETDDMFSGRLWLGAEAKAAGIVDNVGSINSIIDSQFHGLPVHSYGQPKLADYLNDLGGSAGRMAGSLSGAASVLELK